jgi:hypothetical protein
MATSFSTAFLNHRRSYTTWVDSNYGVAANKQGREVKGQMQRTKTVIRIVVLLEPYTNVVNWITAVSSEGLVLVYVYPMKYKSPADYQVA